MIVIATVISKTVCRAQASPLIPALGFNRDRILDSDTGWKPMLLYAVASSLEVHGDSSGRSLASLERRAPRGAPSRASRRRKARPGCSLESWRVASAIGVCTTPWPRFDTRLFHSAPILTLLRSRCHFCFIRFSGGTLAG
jgi:hypothetical protein